MRNSDTVHGGTKVLGMAKDERRRYAYLSLYFFFFTNYFEGPVRIRLATTKGVAHGCRLDAKDVHWRGGVKSWSNSIRIHLIDGQFLYISTRLQSTIKN